MRKEHLEPQADRASVPCCIHGHQWSIENTYYRANGWKNCRPCNAAAVRRYRRRRRVFAGGPRNG